MGIWMLLVNLGLNFLFISGQSVTCESYCLFALWVVQSCDLFCCLCLNKTIEIEHVTDFGACSGQQFLKLLDCLNLVYY